MSPTQCPFAKEGFSKDETIFLGQSCQDKYDVDRMDMGLCVRELQCAQPGAGPQYVAWTQIWIMSRSQELDLGLTFSLLHGLEPSSFSGIQIEAACKEVNRRVSPSPCFCCFPRQSLLMVSPSLAETTPETIILSLSNFVVMLIHCLNTLVIVLRPFPPSLKCEL